MTYYEELGVSPAASVEEIREAYKQLARLLHPDTLRDERSRVVAECQMKRLNSVYETLTHAGRRRDYDQLIGAAVPDPPMLGDNSGGLVAGGTWKWCLSKLRGPDSAWIGAGAIVIVMMAWALADTSPRPAAARIIEPPIDARPVIPPSGNQQSRITARGSEQLVGQVHQLRQQLEEIRVERAAALAQIALLERRLADAITKANALSEMPSITPSPGPIVVPEVAADVSRSWATPAKNDLAGTWHYTASRSPAAGRGLYPPEYIEAVIREESGYLVGRYRARYRVTDRAISPEVVFQFSGKGSSNAARLPWLGEGGSRGEVSLKLITQNTIEIAWIASELGKTQGLGSGTAVLVRRHEP